MADNFDLKKFLKESKAIENLNPILNKENIKKENTNEGTIRDKIKEMIINELEILEPNTSEKDLEEAKKKKDEEEAKDVETTDIDVTDTTEEAPVEDAPEGAPEGGGLEDIAADMEGTEGDLMDALMKALKIAKGMGNEKLTTQVGNTLKFFVSEYIGGDKE
jgi:hypothetical protein